jgi:hypothetical protein
MTDLITTLQGKATDPSLRNGDLSQREKLISALAEYRRVSADQAELEQKHGQAQADEVEALNDHSLDEDSAVDRIARAQARRAVQDSRITAKRGQVSEALKRLESEFPFAEGELRGGCNDELTRRRAIVKARILEAIGLPETPVLPRGLADLIEVSALIRVVKDCMPDMNVFSARSIEAKSEEVLAKFRKLETVKGKAI